MSEQDTEQEAQQTGDNSQTALDAGSEAATTYEPPEKFLVKGDDDAINWQATAENIGKGYSEFEKRMGSGSVRPESVDGYEIEAPEGIDWSEEVKTEETKAFLDKAHELGMTNEQLQHVMSAWYERGAELVGGAKELDAQTATTTLEELWGDDAPKNYGFAYAAAKAVGLSESEMNDPNIGNNPVAIRVLAHFGAQLGEDNPPQAKETVTPDDREALMRSEAYRDPNHPEHKEVYEKVAKSYQ